MFEEIYKFFRVAWFIKNLAIIFIDIKSTIILRKAKKFGIDNFNNRTLTFFSIKRKAIIITTKVIHSNFINTYLIFYYKNLKTN